MNVIKTGKFFAIALASLSVVSSIGSTNHLAEVAEDSRSIWYDRATLPGVYFDHGELFPVGYNVAAFDSETGKKIDPTGSANNDEKWSHTGGLANCGSRVTVKRLLWTPEGKWIDLSWVENPSDEVRNIPVQHVMGSYPVGTTSVEYLYDGIRLFEIRARVKRGEEDWVTEQLEFGDKPEGYEAVDNCVECHDDIGRHSFAIDPKRDWYGVVRGLERGGPIHWHPFKGATNGGVKPEIREGVKGFVRWKTSQ